MTDIIRVFSELSKSSDLKVQEFLNQLTEGDVAIICKRDAASEKRYHDLKNAVRCFDTISKALKAGYRFDDEHCASYIERMCDATGLLRTELTRLEKFYLDHP